MKYTKPATRNSVVLLNFLDSLPAEFEIVEPGMTQVRWPDGWTREYLLRSSRGEYGDGVSLRAWLEALAAIAPEEKKKRKVILMVHESWDSNERPVALYAEEAEKWMRDRSGWRKVGECEVDA